MCKSLRHRVSTYLVRDLCNANLGWPAISASGRVMTWHFAQRVICFFGDIYEVYMAATPGGKCQQLS
jgi:hypothetical protein